MMFVKEEVKYKIILDETNNISQKMIEVSEVS